MVGCGFGRGRCPATQQDRELAQPFVHTLDFPFDFGRIEGGVVLA